MVTLPPITGSLTARMVARLPTPTAVPLDVRSFARAQGTLYVAAREGLAVYDLENLSEPRLLAFTPEVSADDIAVVGPRGVTARVGQPFLEVLDVSDPASPRRLRRLSSGTSAFGGLDARPGLFWHAPGAQPPSRLYFGPEPTDDSACDAPDRERGVMDVWLFERRAIITVHFDDFAGDPLDGNGGYGFVITDVEENPRGCPGITPRSTIFLPTHAFNRSRFERAGNSDMQAAHHPDSGLLAVTGEQRLRLFVLDAMGGTRALGAIDVPEALDVALDPAGPLGAVAAVANGDLVLVDLSDPAAPAIAAVWETPGVSRTVLAWGDGRHFLVTDDSAGTAVIAIERGLAP